MPGSHRQIQHQHSPLTALNREALPPRPIIWGNLLFLTVFAGIAISAAVWYQMAIGITWRELVAGCTIWTLTGMGITTGYHRLFSHCGYKAHPAVKFTLAMLGGAAIQNSAIAWCSDHRYHHAETDTDGDPYDATRGFWYSHMGWIFFRSVRGDAHANVADLKNDPILAWQHKHYYFSLAATNVFLVAVAGLLLGNWLGMIIIAGLLRIVVVQHATFLINSAAHIWGTQPWSNATTSKDNWALSLITFGEGYHNYHHSFQADYRNGPLWYNWDPTKWAIWTFSKLGLASNLRRTPVDVVLSTRYAESSRSFVERLEAWGELKSEEWSALLAEKKMATADRRDGLRQTLEDKKVALQERLLSAEAHLNLSLEDLRSMRASLKERVQMAASETSAELRAASQREVDQISASLKGANRSIKDTYRSWELLLEEYTSALPAVAA
jgi:stearoyl-CoA desaturase (delta-9 desaturase)